MKKIIEMRWYVVGAPWLPSDMTPYIVAGREDPHVGLPVVDPMDYEEWVETRNDQPPDPFEICGHIVELHNKWLAEQPAPEERSEE